MMQRKSLLNPYATPYVPLSKIGPGVSSERENRATLDDSENDIIENSADYQLPDSVSVDHDIQGLEKLKVSDESSSEIGEPWNSDDAFQDVIPRSEKQNVVDDPNLIIEFLSSMFPDISIESLAELFNANHGDLNQTIYVLEQLEYGGYELDSAETSETSNSLDDPPEKANARGTISSV
ncbi:uncharacterized protein LOC103722982 [Phoenix dactylifera]|uniref:Uncharacterized protein LOC103722982 n=1 Tax=Phoenix dactylifera TaxID=42345 RepID=A0A8B9AFK3_PHODC|nr:uncharacterized protein LOC103722982 [Phoenix dactylifera]XP_038984558.1 uncharacterized protein LOC103722982 [Phoenix dactylifera]